jgi:hypothetical protein
MKNYCNSFITLAAGVNVTKLFLSSSLTKWPNKLECLFLTRLLGLVYYLQGIGKKAH